MKLPTYSARDYADAFKALLPPGAVWDWQAGGMGESMLLCTAQELERLEAEFQTVVDTAIAQHRPKTASWNISEYRRVASEALAGIAEPMPRRTAAIGSSIGVRLWSHAAPTLTFPVDLVQVDDFVRPARVGSRIGAGLWGTRSRYVLRVRYYRSVVDPAVLWQALAAFQQAHVFLWFEDITGVGGSYAPN
ncbi:hypothetical protein [Pandoraea apista]|uniref:Bacteriophage protein n=1 Tax=Pandoraea apista TaxID=93218 RepID=A0A5E5P6E4_9BURK|nr:hypothetical protein [Pandoraea apista]AJF00043.1 hypothetical protein SG18_21010 [Pandoraea apista]AKH74199.1 hypothetical protein XM39_21195 [Pandoraea apista]AKI62748.1 bacteriophage protein [Pandoraea apista]VVG72092.1 bacteriophage protein [Pandoraea apista]